MSFRPLWILVLCAAASACAAAPSSQALPVAAGPRAIPATLPLGANEVKSLVYTWFALFDRNAPTAAFVEHIADHDVVMRYPDAEVKGVDGFRAWYAGIQRAIRTASHDLARVDVTVDGSSGGARVELDVVWRATTFDGEAKRLKVRQLWTVVRGATGAPVIRSLSAEVLEN